MANFWSSVFGRDSEERMNIDQLASYFNANNSSPFGGFRSFYSTSEKLESGGDFVGMVNGAYKASGVVFAVCMARMTIFSEARFCWQRLSNGKPGDKFGTKDLAIFENPWPNGTTGDLLARAIQDIDLAGNHYVIREGVGDNARLRRLRPDWVSILLTAPPDQAVASDVEGYLYKPGGTLDKSKWVYYPVDGSNGAIAHWCPVPDPEANFRGMSWLTPVLDEILGDRQATKHKLKFFENAATPNIAVSMKETVTPEQFEEFMRQIDENKAGVDHAYETMYLGGGADVKVIGSHIEQLDFKNMQGAVEVRIAAAGRVHPSIVGLTEGLRGNSFNQGNFQEVKQTFGEATLRPLWRSLCASYAVLVPGQGGARLWFDDEDISFLRRDRKEEAELRQSYGKTINQYVMNGFTWDSAVEAVMKGDLTLLKHTGLFSVQLLPPGTFNGVDANGKDVTATPKDGGTAPPKAGDKPDAKAPPKPDAKAPPAQAKAPAVPPAKGK